MDNKDPIEVDNSEDAKGAWEGDEKETREEVDEATLGCDVPA